MPLSGIANELLRVLLDNEGGLSDDQLKSFFGAKYEQLPAAINELLSSNRIQLFTKAGTLFYKSVKEDLAAKFSGLGPEQILVHQAIERSGNKGIWTRDIKTATSIPQHTLTKTLKILEQRSLIKSVRSVVSKSKKLYMLYDMVPAKAITGGPWYSDQEFDHEFVSELSTFVVQLVRSQNMMDLAAIGEKIKLSGISKIEFSADEVELLVNTLVHDGRLEEVQSSVLLMTGYATAKRMYKASEPIIAPDYLTTVPCGVCPVAAQCQEGAIISPVTCPYLTEWFGTCTSERQQQHESADNGNSGDINSLAW